MQENHVRNRIVSCSAASACGSQITLKDRVQCALSSFATWKRNPKNRTEREQVNPGFQSKIHASPSIWCGSEPGERGIPDGKQTELAMNTLKNVLANYGLFLKTLGTFKRNIFFFLPVIPIGTKFQTLVKLMNSRPKRGLVGLVSCGKRKKFSNSIFLGLFLKKKGNTKMFYSISTRERMNPDQNKISRSLLLLQAYISPDILGGLLGLETST